MQVYLPFILGTWYSWFIKQCPVQIGAQEMTLNKRTANRFKEKALSGAQQGLGMGTRGGGEITLPWLLPLLPLPLPLPLQ